MAEMGRELSACLLSPAEVQPSANLGDLRARVAAITARGRQDYEADQKLQGRHHTAFVKFNEIVSKTARELGELLGFGVTQTSTAGNYLESKLGSLSAPLYYSRDTVYMLRPWGQSIRTRFEVVIAMALRATRARESFDVAAVISIDRYVNEGHRKETENTYDQVYRNIPVGSAQQARVLAEVSATLTENLEPTMRKVIAILQEES
jgi:hypothetical protein